MPNFKLNKLEKYDLNALLGVPAGTVLNVQNITEEGEFRLSTSEIGLTTDGDYRVLPESWTGINSASDTGAWVMFISSSRPLGLLNVRVES